MPIPDYESLMLPLLQMCGDGKPYKIDDVCAHYCALYQTTKSDPVLVGRFSTAKDCLTKASLLETPTTKTFQITPCGKKLIKSPPEKITRVYLQRYPAFVLSQKSKIAEAPKVSAVVKPSLSPTKPPAKPIAAASVCILPTSQTPEELLKYAHCQLQNSLADELLNQIRLSSSSFFEKLVVDLLVAMGYGKGIKNLARVVGGSGDGGIDGIIKEDPLGLGTVYVQAKKRDGASCIGENDIQKFVGALHGYQPCKGVFITTGKFSDGATKYVKTLSCKIALIDGESLVKYMVDYNVGVSVRQTYQIKKIDTDYFNEA